LQKKLTYVKIRIQIYIRIDFAYEQKEEKMNSSIVNLIFLGVIIVFAAVGALKGLKDGLFKSLITLACVVVSAVAAFILTGVIAEKFAPVAAEKLSEFLQSGEAADIAAASPSLREYLPIVASALISPLCFLALFIVCRIVFAIIGGIIKFIFKALPTIPFSRLFGMAVSLVASLVAAVCLLMPFAGYLNAASTYYTKLEDGGVITATEEGKNLEDIIKNSKDKTGVKIVYGLTGKFFDGFLEVKKSDGSKVSLYTELDAVCAIVPHVMDLTETDFSDVANINVQPVYDIIEDLSMSAEIKRIVAEVLSAAATKWKNGEEFMGLNIKDSLPEEYKNSLDASLEKLSNTTFATVEADLTDFAHATEALVKLYKYTETLSSADGTAEKAALELGDALKALTPGAADIIGDAVKTIISNDLGLSDENAETVGDIVKDSLKKVAETETDEEKEKEAEALSEIINCATDTSKIAANADKLVSAVTSSEVIKAAVESAAKAGAGIVVDDKTKKEILEAASAYKSGEGVTDEQKQTVDYLLKLFGLK